MIQIEDFTQKTTAAYFMHIMPAPTKLTHTSQLPYSFEYQCNGTPHKAQIVDVLKMELRAVSDFDSLLSHGMQAHEFVMRYKQNNSGSHDKTLVGLYLIKNLK